jgi:hypothetical protein
MKKVVKLNEFGSSLAAARNRPLVMFAYGAISAADASKTAQDVGTGRGLRPVPRQRVADRGSVCLETGGFFTDGQPSHRSLLALSMNAATETMTEEDGKFAGAQLHVRKLPPFHLAPGSLLFVGRRTWQ